jgi:CheY-like chemotaxis protein/flagellar motility protein MotE (MotC chaperone)
MHAKEPQDPPMNAKTALVVDDSKSARFALRRYLEGHQYRVDAVESAEEAMRFLAARLPEVIFLDHVMPGTDGFEAMRQIRADARLAAIPIVICSSNEGPEYNAQARERGASGVLQKPPNPEQLVRLLDSLVTGQVSESQRAGTESDLPPPPQDAPVTAGLPPPVAAPAIVPELRPPSASAALATFPSAPLAARDDAGNRDQLEVRLRKLSHGLKVQLAEIKATVAHLSSQQTQIAEAPGGVRNELRANLDETNQALRLVTARIESLEREVFAQITSMRLHMEGMLKTHSDRVGEIVQFARQAAAEEAQLVAERTVMSAAMRISDQLSDALLGAVGRR